MCKMITIEEAISFAKKREPELNRYQEHTDAYFFFLDDGVDRIGGPGSGFILKKDGTYLKPYEYFMNPDSDAEVIGEETHVR